MARSSLAGTPIPAAFRGATLDAGDLRQRVHDVVFLHAGRALFVPLSEIRSKIPPLWEGLLAKEELRAAGAQASRDSR